MTPHRHQWGPWRLVNQAGGPPATRDPAAVAGCRRYCLCGAFQHRCAEGDTKAGISDTVASLATDERRF